MYSLSLELTSLGGSENISKNFVTSTIGESRLQGLSTRCGGQVPSQSDETPSNQKATDNGEPAEPRRNPFKFSVRLKVPSRSPASSIIG